MSMIDSYEMHLLHLIGVKLTIITRRNDESRSVANPIKLFLPVNFTSEFSSGFYEEKIY